MFILSFLCKVKNVTSIEEKNIQPDFVACVHKYLQVLSFKENFNIQGPSNK